MWKQTNTCAFWVDSGSDFIVNKGKGFDLALAAGQPLRAAIFAFISEGGTPDLTTNSFHVPALHHEIMFCLICCLHYVL